MASKPFVAKRPLRKLLDNVVHAHREDIKEIASGHLNENKLWNPEAALRVPWEAATMPVLSAKPKVIHHTKKDQSVTNGSENEEMANTVMNFMLGATGSIPRLDLMGGDQESHSSSSSILFLDEDRGLPADKTFTQELVLPDLMLPVDAKKGTKRTQSSPRQQYAFIEMHHALPTKEAQYKHKLKLGTKLVSTRESHNSKHGGSLQVIERNLSKKLAFLQKRHRDSKQPSFYRLQAFSDSWNDVLKTLSEPTAQKLELIKRHYDDYIGYLMDTQRSSKELYQQIDQLQVLDKDLDKEIQVEEFKLKQLENDARELLNCNQRLREELEKEDTEISEPTNKIVKAYRPKLNKRTKEKEKNLEEKVSELHFEIKKCYDEINDLLDKRKNLVPKIVCQRLEQDSKEMELSVHKLCKQNEYLEVSIEKMEEELEELLEKSHASEKDQRSLWKKINTSRLTSAGES